MTGFHYDLNVNYNGMFMKVSNYKVNDYDYILCDVKDTIKNIIYDTPAHRLVGTGLTKLIHCPGSKPMLSMLFRIKREFSSLLGFSQKWFKVHRRL